MIGEFARTPRYQGAGSSQVNPTQLDTALDALPRRARRAPRGRLRARLRHRVRRRRPGAGRRGRAHGRGPPTWPCCSSACRRPTSPRATTGRTWTCRPTRSSCCTPSPTSTRASSWCCPTAPWSPSRRGRTARRPCSRAGCSARRAARPPPTCCSAPSTRPAGSPRPSRCATRTTRRSGDFPGEHGHVRYGEGLLIGYRWYDAHRLPVAYPFGHGLSYTTFDYSDLAVTVRADGAEPEVDVALTVTNTGRPRRQGDRPGLRHRPAGDRLAGPSRSCARSRRSRSSRARTPG